jgi:hypothetical protein
MWWDKYLTAERPRVENGEIYLPYLFRYNGKVYEPVFTIIVSPYGREAWRKHYEDSPLNYLGEYMGHSYSYILPEELPSEFLKPDGNDYDYHRYGKPIRMLKKMVNSVPSVFRSFQIVG